MDGVPLHRRSSLNPEPMFLDCAAAAAITSNLIVRSLVPLTIAFQFYVRVNNQPQNPITDYLYRTRSLPLLCADYIAAAVTFSRQFSTRAAGKPFFQIPLKHRPKAIQESHEVLREYLHNTRSLPYVYAGHIAMNSPRSLSEVVSKVPFSPSASFSRSLRRFLRYHPINEVDFFLESIGISGGENGVPPPVVPPDTYFISDWKHFDVACALAGTGFPWKKLWLLYKEDCLVFENDPAELLRKFNEIKNVYGFNSVCLIGICLAFPQVLYEKMDALLNDLKILILDHDLCYYVDGDVDCMLAVCEKFRVLDDLGCEGIGELMGRSKALFIEYSREVLISKIDYFYKLNAPKDQIGLFLLSRPEIFGFDLESRTISVSGFLKQLGLSENKLESLKAQYPHVFSRNRMVNLPYIMRSLDLGEWFFERMKNGCHSMLGSYVISCIDEGLDKGYVDGLKNLRTQKTKAYSTERLDFLHSIGFGENVFTIKASAQLRCSASQMQERFNWLLGCGIEYPKLCAMVRFRPKILNQKENVLEKKLEFLFKEMGLSLQFLEVFPGYLVYNLERRIKPRYRLHKWLERQGFCKKKYSISTMIAPSEKVFVARISRIHPPSAKKWQENSLQKETREAAAP